MNINNPVTPGSAEDKNPKQDMATPGSNEQDKNQIPDTTKRESGIEEGKVTITIEDYRNLQRNTARLQSIQKRDGLKKNSINQFSRNDNGQSVDPVVAEELDTLRSTNQEITKKAFSLEVKDKVRELLSKPEFNILPPSTKALILKNPTALTESQDVQEAVLDIEDFLKEQVIDFKPINNSSPQEKHEIPNVIHAGTPANPSTAGLEDVSGLRKEDRSRAGIRNALKKIRK